ncbi:MAG: hypothetical protein IJH34_07935 [Romboutsia sp.]|nr:hypothetical protein [Romboutsia sp.]
MFNNISTIINNINNNAKYSHIFDVVENKYFTIEFNSRLEVILSKYCTDEIVKYYMGYKELLDTFLIIVLQGVTDFPRFNIDELEITEDQLKIIALLIYKELDFFVLKIETLLEIDEHQLDIKNYDNHLEIKLKNDELIIMEKTELEKQKQMGLDYYCSRKKIESFVNLLNNLEENIL